MKHGMEEKNQQDEQLNNLTAEDAIFILMYANKEQFLSGKLMFVKQIFLLTKEIISSLFKEFYFYPSNYGPFSKILVTEIENLTDNRYIKVIEQRNYYDHKVYDYILTDEGEKKAKLSFNKLSERTKDKITIKRREWDRLGYRGIIRLVYSKYPEYTIRSKILDEVN